MAHIDNVVAKCDDIAAVYLALKSGADSTLTRLATLRDAVDDIEESSLWENTLSGLTVVRNSLTLESADGDGIFDGILADIFGEAFDGLDADAQRNATANSLTGVTNLKTYLQYMNYGSGVVSSAAWQYLMCPDFATLYEIVQGGALGAKLTYSPAISDMGSRAYGASFVAGTSVTTGSYAGAQVLNLTTASLSGSGLITVTGNGYNASGTVFTNHAWTLSVSGNGTSALTPASTGDICTSVTGITIGSGISAGTFTVKAAVPSGRTNPPT